MIKAKPKIVIGLASIWAGGGHNALRDFLLQELKDQDGLECHSFTHSDESYDRFNDAVLDKAPAVFNAIYKNVPNDYPGVSALKLVEECEEFVKKVDPDMVISTNFGVCCAFGLIKKALKLNFINVFAIPDYGKTGSAAFPTNYYFKPDHVIVFDEMTRSGLIDDFNYPKEKVTLSGYIAKRSFRDLVVENKVKSRETLVAEINHSLKAYPKLKLDPAKRTFVLTGGAGGVMNRSLPLLKRITSYQKKHPEFIEQTQYLVATGQHLKFFNKLLKKQAKDPLWSNIIPLPWVEHCTFVKTLLLAEFPVLITIAPATINELVESGCGPILIYHRRTGPEHANVEFVKANKLGLYLPDSKKVLQILINGFSKKERTEFLTRAEKYRLVREKRIAQLPDVVRDIYARSISPRRKSDKKRLNLGIDPRWFKPGILWAIVLMVLPASLIFTYAEYYKQKHRFQSIPWVASMSRYAARVWEDWNKSS